MISKLQYCVVVAFCISFFSCCMVFGQTVVSMKGNEFYINGKPTYEGRYWKEYKINDVAENSSAGVCISSVIILEIRINL